MDLRAPLSPHNLACPWHLTTSNSGKSGAKEGLGECSNTVLRIMQLKSTSRYDELANDSMGTSILRLRREKGHTSPWNEHTVEVIVFGCYHKIF